MNLILMFQKLYMEMFPWAFNDEFDMNRMFNGLNKFHENALPESPEMVNQWYAKIFKSNLFYLLSPIVYMLMKFYAMKYSNTEYLQRLIERDLEREQ